MKPPPAQSVETVEPLGAMFSTWPCVLDTNVLVFDLIQGAERGRPTALLDSARFKSGRILACEHVEDEVHDVLRRVATRRGADPAAWLEIWNERYAPVIRFVDVPDVAVDRRLEAVRLVDEDDEPTARLALLVAPCFLLSKDKALVGVGLAAPDWLPISLALQFTGRIDAGTITIGNLIGLAGQGCVAAARAAARNPRLTLLGAAVLVTGLLLRRDQLGSDGRMLLHGAKRVTAEIFVALNALLTEREQAVAAISEQVIQPSLDTPIARVSRTLASEREPMSATELAAITQLDPGLVRELLGAHRAFVSVRRRWQLGHPGTFETVAGT